MGAAGDGPDRMSDKASCQFRNEEHRYASRLYFPRTQSAQGSLCSSHTDGLCAVQVGRITSRTVIVVPLHAAVSRTEDRTTQGMAGLRIAADKAVRVAVSPHAAVRPDRGTLGIRDSLVVAQRGRFAGNSEIDRSRGIQVPGMIQVQVGHLGTHAPGIRETGILVLGRVAREGACLAHRLADRIARDVGGAGAPLAGTPVDGDADAAIVGVLEVLHVAQPGGCGEAHIMADGHFCLVDAATPCFFKRAGDDILERLLPERLRCLELAHAMLPCKRGTAGTGRMLDFRPIPPRPVRIEQAE